MPPYCREGCVFACVVRRVQGNTAKCFDAMPARDDSGLSACDATGSISTSAASHESKDSSLA